LLIGDDREIRGWDFYNCTLERKTDHLCYTRKSYYAAQDTILIIIQKVEIPRKAEGEVFLTRQGDIEGKGSAAKKGKGCSRFARPRTCFVELLG